MDTQRRSNLVVGFLLLLVGAWFLAGQYYPNLTDLISIDLEWPLMIVGLGLVFFVFAALARAPGLAIPGAIIAGIGGVLSYQNATGDWESWAYAWTLIPGFVGIGILVSNFFEGRFIKGLKEGASLLFISLILFTVFGGFLGGPEILGDYWPILLIVAGLWMVIKGLLNPKRDAMIDKTNMNAEEKEEL
jgi:hypothetical protein